MPRHTPRLLSLRDYFSLMPFSPLSLRDSHTLQPHSAEWPLSLCRDYAIDAAAFAICAVYVSRYC